MDFKVIVMLLLLLTTWLKTLLFLIHVHSKHNGINTLNWATSSPFV